MNPIWKLTSRWVIVLSIVALLLPLVYIEFLVLRYTNGVFTYPLDDAFIHMAIAKNLAFHHVWGASAYEFSSASSSILYPFLLAGAYKVFGLHLLIPFIINLVVAIIMLILIQKWLQQQGIRPPNQLWILVAVIYLTPLPVMVIIGMEHTIQILCSWLFIASFCEWLGAQEESKEQKKLSWLIYLYAVLVTAVRFEGVFLVVVACLFLLWRKQLWTAIFLGLVAALPIVLFGIYSLQKGSYFLPNSVLLKSSSVPLTPGSFLPFLLEGIWEKIYYEHATKSAVATEKLLLVLPLAYLFYIDTVKKVAAYRYLLIFLLLATFLHLSFASTIWFYRYEAYLIAATVLVLGTLEARATIVQKWDIITTTRKVIIVGAFFLLLPFFLRALTAFKEAPGACRNIFDQNYNMGLFLHKYYDTTIVAINDLGAVSYLTSAKNLDLWGLANIEVARSKRGNYYSEEFLDSIVRREKVKIAVVFDRLYPPGLLQKWKKIAIWHIDETVSSGDANLNFYAVDSTYAIGLKKNLQVYQPLLPSGVRAFYY